MLFPVAVLWYQQVFCITLSFTEKGKLCMTAWFNVINMTESIRIFGNTFLSNIDKILYSSNCGELSNKLLSCLPRRVTYVLRHPKNCFAIRFSKSSKCIALTAIEWRYISMLCYGLFYIQWSKELETNISKDWWFVHLIFSKRVIGLTL